MTIPNQPIGSEIDSSQWLNLNNLPIFRDRHAAAAMAQPTSEDLPTTPLMEPASSSVPSDPFQVVQFFQERHSAETRRLFAIEESFPRFSKFLEEVSSESYKEKLKKKLGLEGLVANLIQQMEHLERLERELDRQNRREIREEERRENEKYRREARAEERRENEKYRQKLKEEERRENQKYRRKLRAERKKDFQEFLESVKDDFMEIRRKLFPEDADAIAQEESRVTDEISLNKLEEDLQDSILVLKEYERKMLEMLEIEETPENQFEGAAELYEKTAEGATGFGEPIDEGGDNTQEFITSLEEETDKSIDLFTSVSPSDVSQDTQPLLETISHSITSETVETTNAISNGRQNLSAAQHLRISQTYALPYPLFERILSLFIRLNNATVQWTGKVILISTSPLLETLELIRMIQASLWAHLKKQRKERKIGHDRKVELLAAPKESSAIGRAHYLLDSARQVVSNGISLIERTISQVKQINTLLTIKTKSLFGTLKLDSTIQRTSLNLALTNLGSSLSQWTGKIILVSTSPLLETLEIIRTIQASLWAQLKKQRKERKIGHDRKVELLAAPKESSAIGRAHYLLDSARQVASNGISLIERTISHVKQINTLLTIKPKFLFKNFRLSSIIQLDSVDLALTTLGSSLSQWTGKVILVTTSPLLETLELIRRTQTSLWAQLKKNKRERKIGRDPKLEPLAVPKESPAIGRAHYLLDNIRQVASNGISLIERTISHMKQINTLLTIKTKSLFGTLNLDSTIQRTSLNLALATLESSLSQGTAKVLLVSTSPLLETLELIKRIQTSILVHLNNTATFNKRVK